MSARTLHVVTPPMKGADVKALQELLKKNPFGNFLGGAPVDGEYGKLTAVAVAHAKRSLGYPRRQINESAGQSLVHFLKTGKLPPSFSLRRKIRRRKRHHPADIRSKIVMQFKWGVANAHRIHYAEIRPVPLKQWQAHKLDLTTDCSGSVTCCYFTAGAPDPNGQKYDTSKTMYTGTLLNHLTRIRPEMAKPGDLIIFVHPNRPTGDHVCGIIEAGGDPLLFSHGQEAGPLAIRLSAESQGHPGCTPVYLSAGV